MKKFIFASALSVLLVVLSFSFFNRADSQENTHEGQFVQADGGGTIPLPTDYISEEQRREIQRQNQANIERLEREGKLPKANADAVVALNWPLQKAANVTDFDIYGISNYVDHNPAFPNQITDYNCGTRSYDQASGYNHAGVDIFTWPFGWYKVDTNGAEIIAAAPGTIINKFNGNFDRNCGFGSGNWNAVYVRHADNSVAWYGHMKNNSLTSKNIGDTVAQGEFLGIVGSSGNSTGPHLHFELYNAANQLQDPYQGTCNLMNNFTWWAAQRPYNFPFLNKLQTHSAPPVFPTCPNTETLNAIEYIRPGTTAYFAAYYRDQQSGMVTNYSVIGPSGATLQSWSHSPTQSYFASYWWWSSEAPLSTPAGTWKFRAVFNGQTYEKTFAVVRSPFDFDADNKTDLSIYRANVGQWWYQQSSDSAVKVATFGTSTDKIVPADYDGDAKTDIAFFRPSTGEWFVLRSSNNTFFAAPFGVSTDIPAPGDFDGDSKADFAVYRPSIGTWFILKSSGGVQTTPFGINGDVPQVGDYDGDGKSDIAIYRPTGGSGGGEWWLLRSSNGSLFATPFGSSSDKPVPGDYTGDAKTDIAFWRPSTSEWYILRSEDLSFYAAPFGSGTDIPVPGDYDGDGKFDLGVFRPSSATWFVLRSSGGTLIQGFGATGDKPVPSAYIP